MGNSLKSYRTEKGDEWCSIVDMLCFTRKWWEDNAVHVPDFVMGPDSMWSRCLMELLKATGGSEIQGGCHRVEEVTP